MDSPIFDYIVDWLRQEREYQQQKFGMGVDVDHTRLEGLKYWDQQFNSYLQRMPIFALDSPAGMQAAAKFVATAMGMLESIVYLYGALPEPGVPSGENLDTTFPFETAKYGDWRDEGFSDS